MPKCPICEKNIISLICEQICTVHIPFYIEDETLGGYEYGPEEVGEVFDDSLTVFLCPECRNIITRDELEAVEFLREKPE